LLFSAEFGFNEIPYPSFLMNPIRLFAFGAGICVAAPLYSQSVLVAVEPGRDASSPPLLVRYIDQHDNLARVEDLGSIRITRTGTPSLVAARLYMPQAMVDVSKLEVMIPPGQQSVQFHGFVSANVDLSHCVIAIVANSPTSKEPSLTADWLPDIKAGQPSLVRMVMHHLPNDFDDTRGTFDIHIYSNGLEVLNSSMKQADIDAGELTWFLARDFPNPRPLHVAAPVYPADLKAKAVAGTAKIQFTVKPDGTVGAISLVQQSDPAFGAALMAAAHDWKFVPAVKNHQFVSTVAQVPFTFRPPAPPPAQP
jgi:TonB family protein